MKKVLFVLMISALYPNVELGGQVIAGVVTDPGHTATTGVLAVVTEVGNFIRRNGVEILEWTQKALQVVNAVVANYELVQKTEAVFTDIFLLYLHTYNLIGGHPDLEDKVKYTLVLQEIMVQGIDELEIFSSVFAEGLNMDDRGRIGFLKEAYQKAKKYRRVMRQLRVRVTREIFSKGLTGQSREVLEGLFGYN